MNSYYYNPKKVEAILPKKPGEELTDYLIRYAEGTHTNKKLKAIRNGSKSASFALNYLCKEKKLAKTAKISLEEAEIIYNRYHKELYKGVADFKDNVLEVAKKDGKVHLGLGCYLKTKDVNLNQRTLFNACSQFWSIITLLTINKMHHLIDAMGYSSDIKCIATIYDSIYFIVKDDVSYIKWLNDNIVPILTTKCLVDQVVPNEAELDIGYDWYNMKTLANNATAEEINNIKRGLLSDES